MRRHPRRTIMTTRDPAAIPAAHGGPVWLEPMPVRDWMQPAPVTVRPDTTVGAAAELLRARVIRHLPVVDGEGRLVGIVTDRDLRQVVFDPAILERLGDVARGLAALPLREVMTWGVVSVRPGSDLREAARVMHERRIGALPVSDGGRLVGILTEIDVLRALDEVLRHRLAGIRPVAGPAGGAPYEYGFTPPQTPDDTASNGGVVD